MELSAPVFWFLLLNGNINDINLKFFFQMFIFCYYLFIYLFIFIFIIKSILKNSMMSLSGIYLISEYILKCFLKFLFQTIWPRANEERLELLKIALIVSFFLLWVMVKLKLMSCYIRKKIFILLLCVEGSFYLRIVS